jgi:hypothetical protein
MTTIMRNCTIRFIVLPFLNKILWLYLTVRLFFSPVDTVFFEKSILDKIIQLTRNASVAFAGLSGSVRLSDKKRV